MQHYLREAIIKNYKTLVVVQTGGVVAEEKPNNLLNIVLERFGEAE